MYDLSNFWNILRIDSRLYFFAYIANLSHLFVYGQHFQIRN